MPRNSGSGFTLIEVVVAFAILALVLGVVFEAVGTNARNARLAEQYTVATLWAESKLAALGIETDLVAGETQGQLPVPYRWRSRVTPIVAGTDAIGESNGVQLYEVVLTVEWGTGRNARSVSLTTERLVTHPRDDKDVEADR